jgi:glutamate-ammonia-ligase adenylyltransferase
LAERLAARPELVDELLHEATLYSAPSRAELHSLVRQQLLRIPEEDLEAQMNALSRIKDGVVLRVAASELSGTLPIMNVSDNLTFLAEAMVEHAVVVARAELVKRFGEPEGDRAGLAVMAYGKLGGIELSYGSDLDLVFVFDGADGQTAGPKVIDNALFYTRLAQRVVHVLSAQTLSGRLYEIDLRLRPDGDSGLVATTLSALRRYQLESAWTWEHQALVRSRTVAGDSSLKKSLEALRREVLALPRDHANVARDVCDMRGKMRAEHEAVSQPRHMRASSSMRAVLSILNLWCNTSFLCMLISTRRWLIGPTSFDCLKHWRNSGWYRALQQTRCHGLTSVIVALCTGWRFEGWFQKRGRR